MPKSHCLKIGAFLSLFTAMTVAERLAPTMCCIWPEMPAAMYSFGVTVMPETPT